MKKYSFILLAALALGFTACEEGPAEAPVQSNPQPPIFESTDVTVVPQELGAIDIAALNEAGQSEVCVARLSKLANLADGFNLDITAEFAAEGYAYEEDGEIVLLPEDEMESITMGSFPVTVKGDELWANTADLQNAYLAIYGVQNEQEDVYIIFNVGTRYAATAGDQYAFVGKYAPMTITMTPDFLMKLYVIVNGQQTEMCLSTDNGIRFIGFVYLTGNFKLGDQRKGAIYGADYDDNGTEILALGAKSDITLPNGEGLYYVDCSTGVGTLKVTLIESVSMIGDFNDWDGDLEMTPVPGSNNLVWTVTATLPANSLWKFRMNNSWNYNLGGEPDNLQPNGTNLEWPGDGGEHTVTLYLNETPNRCTIQ